MAGTNDEPDAGGSPLGDAVLDALRGALHIVGGFVQMAAGITRLIAVTAIKAVEAVDHAVEATEEDEKPKPASKAR